jgi:hypothetical protein
MGDGFEILGFQFKSWKCCRCPWARIHPVEIQLFRITVVRNDRILGQAILRVLSALCWLSALAAR